MTVNEPHHTFATLFRRMAAGTAETREHVISRPTLAALGDALPVGPAERTKTRGKMSSPPNGLVFRSMVQSRPGLE